MILDIDISEYAGADALRLGLFQSCLHRCVIIPAAGFAQQQRDIQRPGDFPQQRQIRTVEPGALQFPVYHHQQASRLMPGRDHFMQRHHAVLSGTV